MLREFRNELGCYGSTNVVETEPSLYKLPYEYLNLAQSKTANSIPSKAIDAKTQWSA